MERLARLRRLKGFSQRALAKESGVSPATIYALENGRREPNPSTLRKLASSLEVEVADLVEEPEVPKQIAPPSLQPRLNGFAEEERRAQDFPKTPYANLSAEELETELFGAVVEGDDEPSPVKTERAARNLPPTLRHERDALEEWIEAYESAPASEKLRMRANRGRAELLLNRAKLYYLVVMDYWSKLADPRGVPFKGIRQIASESRPETKSAEASALLAAIRQAEEEREYRERSGEASGEAS
jgi:transcriptional regulator with XRE-family HTH domain